MYGDHSDPRRYDDIIGLPHHVSMAHTPMSRANRAAQFAPFAALTGYDAAVKETARLTDAKMELDDDQKLLLSSKLQLLHERIRSRPEAAITYFQPDERKSGGAYVTVSGVVKKVDAYTRRVVMANDKSIPIDDLIAIDGELFRRMDELE